MGSYMSLLRYIFPLTAAFSLIGAYSYADIIGKQTSFQRELEESDMQVLNDFINAKRKIPLIDKSKNLKISGEVHTEWNYYTEKTNGKNVRNIVFKENEIVDGEIVVV